MMIFQTTSIWTVLLKLIIILFNEYFGLIMGVNKIHLKVFTESAVMFFPLLQFEASFHSE